MKWIGQHIWSFISRFRNKVYLEDIEEITQEHTVMVGPDGILTKSAHPSERSRLQVRNDEGVTIPLGSPLYSKGEIGGSERILVGVCDADHPAKMPCIGIAEVEMNTTSTKDNFAITQGVYNGNIHGFTGLSVNDILYVQDDGSLSQSKPTGQDSKVQNVGIVLKTNGTICQGLLVSAIGRSNDVPNLDDGYIFLGNSSNISQPSSFSSTFENLTDVIIGSDEIKGSSGNVIFSSFSDVVKAPLGLFTNSITGYDNADFELKAGGNVQFTLDVDNNETAQSFSFRDGGAFGSFTEIANLDQSGNLQIDGDLTVGGNDLKNNNGITSLSFDAAGNVLIYSSIIGGTYYGNVSGNVTGDVTGDLTGNADTATSLTAGNQNIDGDLTLGANQAGHSLNLFGATTNLASLVWSASNNFLKFSDQAKIVFGTGVAAADFDSSIQADGSNLVIYNDTGNIQIGDTVEITGDLTVTGDVTVSGNEIKDDDGTTCITFDSSGNTTIANTLNANVIGDLTGNASTATALTAGNKTLDGNFTLDTGHTLTTPFLNTYHISAPSGTDNDLNIASNGNVLFTLDNNTNETNQSFTFRNHTGMGNYTDMLTLDESGHFTLYGDGNDDPTIILNQNNNTDSAGSPRLEFFRNNVQPDNNELGEIVFKCRHQYGSENEFAKIIGIVEDTTFSERGGAVKIQVASHDGEIVDGLVIEDGDAEDEVDVTIGSGSNSLTNVSGNLKVTTNIELGHASDTTLTRTAAGEVSIEGNKIVTENYVKHVLNCGWYGSSTSRQYLPFGYGGTFEATSPSGYLEYGAFIAPCNGEVESVIIRSEIACGNSTVGIHIAQNGTEMPSFNPGTGVSDTVNMADDDTSYKFESFDGQYDDNLNTFNAGDIIVVSFDPSAVSQDSVATMVLNLDWTNSL